MNKSLSIVIIFLLFFSGTPGPQKEKKDWSRFYKQYKGEACFVLYDLMKDKYYIYNEKRAEKGFIPASTFKIFNSLAALETGVVKDENDTIRWDGVKRNIPEWNRDQDMRSAIKYSVVWFYQETARRIGRSRMQHYINIAGYGNRNINNNIDDFWLKGKLRITPIEQINLLKRLYKNDLPFSQRSMDIVKDILINEKTSNFTLHAKTGWASTAGNDVGWWVGYIETKDNVYFFANCMDLVNPGDENGRITAAKNILKEMGIYR